jgi:hypothetical protein
MQTLLPDGSIISKHLDGTILTQEIWRPSTSCGRGGPSGQSLRRSSPRYFGRGMSREIRASVSWRLHWEVLEIEFCETIIVFFLCCLVIKYNTVNAYGHTREIVNTLRLFVINLALCTFGRSHIG